MKTAVIIARFQTPYLHQGHIELLNTVQTQHNKLIVVLGVSPLAGSRRNPYDYATREKMIKSQYPEAIILPLKDHPSDKQWSLQLDELLKSTFPTEQFLLYGSRDSFISSYAGKHECQELPAHGDYNATEIRAKYGDKTGSSKDFRAGILYAYHKQYTKVYPTVDVAVLRNEKQEILLGKKLINNKWRLIGGYADPEDDSFEQAAQRELQEECGAIETGKMNYETSAKIQDWRYKNEADKIITTLFSCDYLYGNPVASDDIDQLAWFSWKELKQMITKEETTEEHQALFEFLLNKYE